MGICMVAQMLALKLVATEVLLIRKAGAQIGLLPDSARTAAGRWRSAREAGLKTLPRGLEIYRTAPRLWPSGSDFPLHQTKSQPSGGVPERDIDLAVRFIPT